MSNNAQPKRITSREEEIREKLQPTLASDDLEYIIKNILPTKVIAKRKKKYDELVLLSNKNAKEEKERKEELIKEKEETFKQPDGFEYIDEELEQEYDEKIKKKNKYIPLTKKQRITMFLSTLYLLLFSFSFFNITSFLLINNSMPADTSLDTKTALFQIIPFVIICVAIIIVYNKMIMSFFKNNNKEILKDYQKSLRRCFFVTKIQKLIIIIPIALSIIIGLPIFLINNADTIKSEGIVLIIDFLLLIVKFSILPLIYGFCSTLFSSTLNRNKINRKQSFKSSPATFILPFFTGTVFAGVIIASLYVILTSFMLFICGHI